MSTQKGNVARTRPQKHQNKSQFKNDLHDKSHKMKVVNGLEISNVCLRCKNIIEWKIKYKKYKTLKAPSNCVKCHNKNVKHAYHTICTECSNSLKVCPKCGENKELVESTSIKNIDDLIKSPEVKEAIKSLPERKRRTFYRQLNNLSSDLKTEQDILAKLNTLSLGSGEKMSDSFDIDDFNSNENTSSSESSD